MAITFACKRVSEEDIIRCAFNIKKTPYKIFSCLLHSEKKIKIQEISKKLKLKRSTIQKSLKILLEKDLIKRSQKNLPEGGYIYYYSCKNKQDIKKRVKILLEKWHKNALSRIKKI